MNGVVKNDFIKIVRSRATYQRISIFPVSVQGASAAAEISSAINHINEKFYLKSLKEIIFYPNNLDKIKLFLILIVPKKISNRILNLR